MRTYSLHPITFLVATMVALVLLPQAPAAAQQRVERYQPPSGPTLSPYLDLFRQDSGLVDPFNAFVRPAQRQQAQARQFQRAITTQQQTINQLQGQVQTQLQMRPTGARPTGTGATFMNHSHFYPRGGPTGTGRQ